MNSSASFSFIICFFALACSRFIFSVQQIDKKGRKNPSRYKFVLSPLETVNKEHCQTVSDISSRRYAKKRRRSGLRRGVL